MSDFVDLPDLAAEGFGGAALVANDEFFAEKENLLKPHEAEWREHVYTDRGKWMDGWETRRRRDPGHDWCVIRLGLPGVIRGVVVDTKWFRGNFPSECALDAAVLAGPLDLDQIAGASWTEIVPRSPLKGDARNLFEVAHPDRVTHVRLRIFPDGGVARLRVHGEVTPDWSRLLRLGGPIDLAALENGAQVISCSDMFFGSRNNLIKPGRAVNMSDGWETRRRRGPGNDWAIVKLAAPGVVRRAEVDTTHFKGNAPGSCTLELGDGPEPDGEWRLALVSKLQPHTRHVFDEELRRVGSARYARLSVFPDGGVARLRLWGEAQVATHAGVARLNALPRDEAAQALRAVCGSRRWVEHMVALRPFEAVSQLVRLGERVWWQLSEEDWLEAFAAHPKIGQRSGARWSTDEQKGVEAGALDELAAANRAYEEKHGFIFIVCATGKSGAEMLELLRARLETSRDEEIRTAAEEQAKIMELRLRKWVEG